MPALVSLELLEQAVACEDFEELIFVFVKGVLKRGLPQRLPKTEWDVGCVTLRGQMPDRYVRSISLLAVKCVLIPELNYT